MICCQTAPRITLHRTPVHVPAETDHIDRVNLEASIRSNSHFAECGCVRSTSRSTSERRTAWRCAGMLRLVETTQPRSASK
jgi:hypothetical protein